LAGAGLDVFEIEPILSDNPLLTLENVIVTPHAACWSADCFSRVAERVIQAIVTVMQKGRPDFIVNPALLDHPQWRHLK
jgi:phosphoglycerate dehydrogenase-like enzyme